MTNFLPTKPVSTLLEYTQLVLVFQNFHMASIFEGFNYRTGVMPKYESAAWEKHRNHFRAYYRRVCLLRYRLGEEGWRVFTKLYEDWASQNGYSIPVWEDVEREDDLWQPDGQYNCVMPDAVLEVLIKMFSERFR